MLQTILMADDSLPMHAVVRAQLEQDDIRLESAYDGTSALSKAVSIQPNLILLDIDMPRGDGFEVCRALKADAATASIPLLFLTADSVLASKVKGLDLGAVDYITKPFKAEEFRARVRCGLRAQCDSRTPMFDAQTGLHSRAYFDAHLPAALSKARQSGRPLACIVAGIDDFRSIGTRRGKAVGDEVQRAVGHIFQGHCRGDDILCRVGGGKFAILLNGTSSATAAKIVKRLASDVEQRMHVCAGVAMNVMCTFGVADTLGAAGEANLIDRALAAADPVRQLA